MQFPKNIEEKVLALIDGQKLKNLKEKREHLTTKYKEQSGQSKSLIESGDDSLIYAVSRMPATYVVLNSLINTLARQGLIGEIERVFDVGSGTGAGWFAIKDYDESIDCTMFERDKNMADIAKKLTDVQPVRFDLLKDNIEQTADLVLSSYVLSELTESDRIFATRKLAKMSDKYLLIVDTGTPKTYEEFMKLVPILEKEGYFVVAPCKTKKCSLENDYCQFFARVERSAILRASKGAELSYEDEKYFYLLLSKEKTDVQGNRVIRRPKFAPNLVEHTLCSSDGVIKKVYTKREKELFKKAKKASINDLI